MFSRFGFSDFLTPLLALETSVVLHAGGTLPLETFMNMPYKKDILEKIVINKNGAEVSYQMLRNAEADFPIVNLAAAKTADTVKVTVGARSGKAVIAAETSAYLTSIWIRLTTVLSISMRQNCWKKKYSLHQICGRQPYTARRWPKCCWDAH